MLSRVLKTESVIDKIGYKNYYFYKSRMRTYREFFCRPSERSGLLGHLFLWGRKPSRDEIMAEDIRKLKQCDYINHLPNWEDSEGARKEHRFAVENNITILQVQMLSRGWN